MCTEEKEKLLLLLLLLLEVMLLLLLLLFTPECSIRLIRGIESEGEKKKRQKATNTRGGKNISIEPNALLKKGKNYYNHNGICRHQGAGIGRGGSIIDVAWQGRYLLEKGGVVAPTALR